MIKKFWIIIFAVAILASCSKPSKELTLSLVFFDSPASFSESNADILNIKGTNIYDCENNQVAYIKDGVLYETEEDAVIGKMEISETQIIVCIGDDINAYTFKFDADGKPVENTKVVDGYVEAKLLFNDESLPNAFYIYDEDQNLLDEIIKK